MTGLKIKLRFPILLGTLTLLVGYFSSFLKSPPVGHSGPLSSRGPGCFGADIPWVAYEAEDGVTNAAIHGPSRTYFTPEAESSGRKFVQLNALGDYVEFTASQSANGMVLRCAIPDSPGGGGIDSTLSVYVNGKFEKKLPVTSRFSWIYGDFPWSNDPGKGKGHHFFDESHVRIRSVSKGDVIRLQKDASDSAAYYLVDLIELEQVAPPLPQPNGSISITSLGAIPDDSIDDSAALLKCIEAAKSNRTTVWIPEGNFLLNGARICVGDVRVCGAGIWYSKLTGSTPMFEGVGQAVEFSDLAIFGQIDHRNDDSPDNAFDGSFGNGSAFRNLWIEHFKCGFWTCATERMRVEGCRIRNTMADGLNFCEGTTHSVVQNCHLRNTGDDALATWSPTSDRTTWAPCIGNAFIHNTIQFPWLANGIALYGGSNHLIADNQIEGTVFSGGGILVSSGFQSVPFGGTIRVRRNRIVDAGGDCHIGDTVGGLWIHAKDSDIFAAISVSGLHALNSPNSAITIHGPKKVADLSLTDIEIIGARGPGIEIKPGANAAPRISEIRVSENGR